MADPRLELERFEQVEATAGTLLLRLAGRWRAETPGRLPAPILLLDEGSRVHRLEPLPGPGDSAPAASPDAPAWRVAFSAPAELLTHPGVAFALELGPELIVDLRARLGSGCGQPRARPGPLPPRPRLRPRGPLRPRRPRQRSRHGQRVGWPSRP